MPGGRFVPSHFFPTLFGSLLLIAAAPSAVPAETSSPVKSQGAFQQVPKVQYQLGGIVGDRVDANIDSWLVRAPLANPGMTEMFRVRDRKPVPQLVPWAGEFVGKYLISAIQARRMSDDPRVEATIRRVLEDLMSTQDEDGYLGPFRKEERLLGQWDLWGHYHAILALLMWYEDTGDARALESAKRAGDKVCEVYLDTDRRPIQAGSDEMNLAIIHGLGRLYRHSGEERYLRMMKVVEEDWEKAGDYFRQGLAGVPFYKIPRPRWESLHDLQGLVELFLITGNEEYKTSFTNLWRSIARFDRHNSGGFSTGEAAIGNPYTPGAIETCCTTAWAAMSADMLLITGEGVAADELEWSLYNSILGSQHPTGRWWTYNTPMDGKREASAHSIVFQSRAGTPELNCCSVNAPRGIGVISEWAILTDSEGALVLNYFSPMKADVPMPDGNSVRVVVEGDYPVTNRVSISLFPSKPVGEKNFPVRIRIPAWSKKTRVRVGERVMEPDNAVIQNARGKYLTLLQEWGAGDKIELELDFTIRPWLGNGPALGKVSLYRGPVLLAFDQRDNEMDCDAIPHLDFTKTDSIGTAGEVAGDPFPALVRMEYTGADGRSAVLRDFATAGAAGTEYASWIPVDNAPPPGFHLLSPTADAEIAAGPNKFMWYGARNDTIRYRVQVAKDAAFTDRVYESEPTYETWAVVRHPFEDGGVYYWRVASVNAHGETISDETAFSFCVNAKLPNPFIDHPALLGYREDGLVSASTLDATGEPAYGYLDLARNVVAAADREGREGGAVAVSRGGMLRYKVPAFPAEDYTMVAWFAADELPEGGLSQLFCAWARGGDDPLRVVIEGGHLFARIEGGGSANSSGHALTAGEWTHVAAVKKGASLALYVNGKRVSQTFAPSSLPGSVSQAFALGGNPYHSGDESFVGRIDDFALWAKALSGGEIEKVYREGWEVVK